VVSQGYEVQNGAGLVGAYFGGLLVDFFGIGAFAWPLAFFAGALQVAIRRLELPWWRWFGFALFTLCAVSWAESEWALAHVRLGWIVGGGFVGRLLLAWGEYFLHPLGAFLIWLLVLLVSTQLLGNTTIGALFKRLGVQLADLWIKYRERMAKRARRAPHGAEQGGAAAETSRKDGGKASGKDAKERAGLFGRKRKASEKKESAKKEKSLEVRVAELRATSTTDPTGGDDDSGATAEETPAPWEKWAEPAKPGPAATSDPTAPAERQGSGPVLVERDPDRPARGELPKALLLKEVAATKDATPEEVLRQRAAVLEGALADFGIQGEVTAVLPGPVVTMYEYKPAPGVKVSRIAGLTDDLARALKALAVRIEAPIPGKDAVGIEVPNEIRHIVWLREIMESKAFMASESLLTMALGKDIEGTPQVADLAKMPHLLVAGATGAGKSVCLNSILLSFLYKATPEQVKLLLVDPKRIELAVYADLPHLVHPVVTEMSQAKTALDWAVWEMDRRYEAMAKLGVRNVKGYNEKLAALGDERPENLRELEPMPYLVIIIDELADLMLTAAKEVETSIVRLAQLARASGIHLILATQRPSVDVVTGLIKANFPCRISFQVTSKHDSRTILDTVGAEHLLGKGDMLFKPSGGKLRRLHGCFVPDEDVVSVVAYWKKQQPPSFDLDFADWAPGGGAGAGPAGALGDLEGDSTYPEVVEFVMTQGKASISMIQRRFRIGFNRAARYVEQMEQDGVIGPADGSKPRTVIRGE
jgi:S-DNA-T family DNA segregation ATPase FtsK/SpoIIIE